MRFVHSVTAALCIGLALRLLAPATAKEFQVDPRAIEVVERFEREWRAANSVSFRNIKTERMRDGKVVTEELLVKYMKPGRAYLRMLRPHPGQEIIYDSTKNTTQLLVHPGRFPDLTLWLDIEGSLTTRNQHHSVASVGFDQAVHILRSGIERALREPYGDRLDYAGKTTFDGQTVERVVMKAGKHPPSQVAARTGETLFSFARRVDMDAYVIYMANPDIRSLSSTLDGGRSYVVPAYYAPRSESWFSETNGMPLKQTMWSADRRLYESYEHLELRVNRELGDSDFDPDNPAYGF